MYFFNSLYVTDTSFCLKKTIFFSFIVGFFLFLLIHFSEILRFTSLIL